MNEVKVLIADFANMIAAGDIEIYNEFSLQHELGIYLRSELPTKKIQFERNISFFNLDKTKFIKKEIDIVVYSDKNAPDVAIELKYPQHEESEQMLSFCQDVQFAEELKAAKFKETYAVIFTDDHLFYSGERYGIYAYFRDGDGNKPLSGDIVRQTEPNKGKIEARIAGSYSITWRPVKDKMKYTLIQAQ